MDSAIKQEKCEFCGEYVPSYSTIYVAPEGNVVRARIDSDLESYEDYGHPPLIVIDGKEIRWDEFGRMLMTYEGFNFKLEIFDRSEEMP